MVPLDILIIKCNLLETDIFKIIGTLIGHILGLELLLIINVLILIKDQILVPISNFEIILEVITTKISGFHNANITSLHGTIKDFRIQKTPMAGLDK